MKSKRFIVTGGAGFIGSHLVDKLLDKGHKVIVIDNLSNGRLSNLYKSIDKIKFVKQNIQKSKIIDKHFKNADYVFHLAALADIVPSIQNPKEYFDSNVDGTLSVLRCCLNHNIKKIIYTASASCYGISKEIPTSEKSQILPQYPYALTKRLGEELVLHWSEVYNLNFTSFRLFNVYGPRSRTTGAYGAMFGVFLAQKIANKQMTIVGNGNQKRDFTYVSDVVDGLLKSINNKKSDKQILNLGTGKAVSVNQIVKMLNGKKTFIPKRPGEPDITVADITKIKKYLNWKPKVSINLGIKKLLDNIDYWKKAPIWTPAKIKHATKDWFKYLK
jgi:UDP-glucose 4-epimerase